MEMKKMLNAACAGAGGNFIGCFADELDTVIGCVFFGLGVIMVASALIIAFKMDKQNKAEK